MTDPTEPTTPGVEPTPGTDLERKARGDVTVITEESTQDPPKSGRLKAVLIGLLVVVGLAAIATIAFALLSPQGAPTDPNAQPSAEPSGDAGTAAPVEPEPEVPTGPDVCTTNTASVALGTATPEPGTTVVPIVFTNTSDETCSLEGFPTVAFVRASNGTPIGAPSITSNATDVALVELAPGASATSSLRISTTLPADCQPLQADGMRIFIPRSEESYIIDTTEYQACENTDVELLVTEAIVAG